MRALEAASLVKRYGERAIACPHLQDVILARMALGHEVDEHAAIAPMLVRGIDSDVLDLQHAVAHIVHDALARHDAVDLQDVEIAIDHALLLVGKQEQGQVTPPVAMFLANEHGRFSLRRGLWHHCKCHEGSSHLNDPYNLNGYFISSTLCPPQPPRTERQSRIPRTLSAGWDTQPEIRSGRMRTDLCQRLRPRWCIPWHITAKQR